MTTSSNDKLKGLWNLQGLQRVQDCTERGIAVLVHVLGEQCILADKQDQLIEDINSRNTVALCRKNEALDSKNDEIATLKARVKELEASTSPAQADKNLSYEREQVVDGLRNEIEDLKNQVNERDAEIARLKHPVRSEVLEVSNDWKTNRIRELEEIKEGAQRQLDTRRQRIIELEEASKEFEENAAIDENEIANIHRELSKEAENHQKLRENYAGMRCDLYRVTGQLKRYMARVEMLNSVVHTEASKVARVLPEFGDPNAPLEPPLEESQNEQEK